MKQELSSLSLTSDYFAKLLEVIYKTFIDKHNLKKLPKNFQLFGYGDYDDARPSLKKDFEEIGTEFINGKYLYDKTRELHKGKPIIKVNKYYKSIILLYIGYSNFQEFIDDYSLSKNETEKQLELISNESSNRIYYYISYYFGEDSQLLKGQTIISENFKKIQHTYIYPQNDGTIKTHYNYGSIVRREDTLHIATKTLLDGKLVEGGNEIYYIGHNDPSNTNYLVGTYSTFDIYTQPVAGKSILEKCESKGDMEKRVKSRVVPPYIAIELRNQRIVTNNKMASHYNELSRFTPYAPIYNKLPGIYTFNFKWGNSEIDSLRLRISSTNYKVLPLNEEVYIEEDAFQLLNKGSLLHFYFKLAGLSIMDRVHIYIKSYFLNSDNNAQDGVFSGVDNENRLVNGSVELEFKSEQNYS